MTSQCRQLSETYVTVEIPMYDQVYSLSFYYYPVVFTYLK